MVLNGVDQTFLYKVCNNFENLGISFSDGDSRAMNRNLLKRALHKYTYQKNYLEVMANHECSLAVDMIRAKKGKTFDVRDAMTLSTNTSFQIILGKRFASDDDQFRELRHQMDDFTRRIGHFQTFLDFLPWLKNWSSDFRSLNGTMQSIYKFIEPIVAEHQANFDPTKDEPRNLIEEYLAELASEHHGARSLKDLPVFIKDVIVGASEGPAIMLIWILMLLAKHPKVQALVHSELDGQLTDGRAPRLSDEAECVYTRAVIDETARFVTLTPFNRHFSTRAGGTTLHGYHIPANSVVLVDQRAMHHDPEVWGDPEAFRPERFLTEGGENLARRVYGFGYGIRQCPGEKWARSLVFIFLAGVLQKFRLHLPEGTGLEGDGVKGVGNWAKQTHVIAEERV